MRRASLIEKVLTGTQTVLCFICYILTIYLLAIVTQQVKQGGGGGSGGGGGEFKVFEEVNPFLNDYVKNVTN